MNPNEEYFQSLYEYQKRAHRLALKRVAILFGIAIAFVGLLMFFFLPAFWPWNQ